MIHLAICLNALTTEPLPATLFKLCKKHDCVVIQSQLNYFGDHVYAMLLVQGEWSGIARLETTLEQEHAATIKFERVTLDKATGPVLRYCLNTISMPRPEICAACMSFIQEQKLQLIEQRVQVRATEQTGEAVQLLELVFNLTAEQNLSTLREQFALFCETLNIDGFIEPERLR